MVFLVQRDDCDYLSLAEDIDPAYAKAMAEAKEAGVEVLAYWCTLSPQQIELTAPLPLKI